MPADRPSRTLRLELTCEDPPPTGPGAPVEFGLQLGRENLQDGAPAGGGDLRFSTDASAQLRDDGSVRWSGPAIQGPSRTRFLYLSCRARGGPPTKWMFRLKVPLDGIDASLAGLDGRGATGPVRLEGRCRATRGGMVRLVDEGWVRRPAR